MREVLNGSIIEVGMKEFIIQVPVVDREVKAIEFENRRWLYLLSLPLMGMLVLWVFLKKKILGRNPKINTFWFDGLGSSCRQIKKGAASWKALDIIYNYSFGQKKGFGGIVDDFWIGMINAQAVRNRKLLVAEQLSEIIKKIYLENGGSEVRIFSIASGSAQAVFEAIGKNLVPVKVCLLDLDQRALDYSLFLAQKMEVKNLVSISTIYGTAINSEEKIRNFQPHIIEMVGFMDYRPKEKAIRLVQKIYRSIPAGGYFLTANICPNPEQDFLKWVINWSMIYRKPCELAEILKAGGFRDPTIFLEPQGLHAVAICRKFV